MEEAPLPGAQSRLPRKFAHYLLFDKVGAGGMAEIFLARAKTELGGQRLVVVKQILPALAANPQFSEMLIHEAKLAARLDHANVVQVTDLGRQGDQLYIAMEYVEGLDLNDLLRRCTKLKVPLPAEFALPVVTSVLRGLDYAHRRTDDEGRPLGLVHRDVSPSNVLVSFEGQIKLCDFGIAHANELAPQASGSRTAEALKGKAGYMSPEHARGEPVDARADVFAAGILLWELVSGRRMYRADPDGPTLLELARRAEVPPLPSRGLPNEAALAAIAQLALAPDREQRYVSAAAMLRDLERYIGDAKLATSQLRLGGWMVENLGAEVVEERRRRQRAAEALELGPPVRLTPMPFPLPPATVEDEPSPEAVDSPAPPPPELPAAETGPTGVRRPRDTNMGPNGILPALLVLAAIVAAVYAFRGL